jgi:hypothetical protein
MCYVVKTLFFTFYLFLLCTVYLHFHVFLHQYNQNLKSKSFVEVYPIEGNLIEVCLSQRSISHRQKCRRSIRLCSLSEWGQSEKGM